MSNSRRASLSAIAAVLAAGGAVFTQGLKSPGAAALTNPVTATPQSLAVGKTAYDLNCASCHGNSGQGAAKAGIVVSIIAEQGGKQPPDLTDQRFQRR